MNSSPRRHRRRIQASGLLLAGLLIGVGCSNSSSSTDSGDKTSKSSTGGLFEASAFNQPQVEGEPQQGGSIKFALESNLSTLIPGDMAQPADVVVGLAVYDSLVGFDDEGHAAANQLATGMESSDDLKSWTFTLREGVKFSDGEPFNAAAVVTQMDALKARPKCLCKSDVDTIESVVAVDDNTVRFTLKEPNVAFPVVLSGSTGWIASPKAWAAGEASIDRNPVGTGAFVMKDYNSISLEKNPNYWRKDAKGRSLPYLDKIQFVPYPDTNTRLQALESGDVDVIQTADTNNLVNASKNRDLVVQPVTGASSTILVLNSSKPPFDDIRARQAFNYALDRDAVNQQGYQGARVPAYGPLTAEDPYFDPEGQLPTHDLDKAKQLVAELKADNKSVDFEAVCISTSEASRIFQIVSQQMKAAGFSSKQVQVDQGAYVARMFSKEGDFQEACFRSGMIADPDRLTPGLETGGGTNIALYSNPTVDEALEKGRETTDFDERKKQYDIVQEQLAKDVVIVPLLFDLYGNVHTKDVSGFPRPRRNSLGLITVADLYRVAS